MSTATTAWTVFYRGQDPSAHVGWGTWLDETEAAGRLAELRAEFPGVAPHFELVAAPLYRAGLPADGAEAGR